MFVTTFPMLINFFAKKKLYSFFNLIFFIAGMFAKTSFLIYLIVLIAVASSFVSVALMSKISIHCISKSLRLL